MSVDIKRNEIAVKLNIWTTENRLAYLLAPFFCGCPCFRIPELMKLKCLCEVSSEFFLCFFFLRSWFSDLLEAFSVVLSRSPSILVYPYPPPLASLALICRCCSMLDLSYLDLNLKLPHKYLENPLLFWTNPVACVKSSSLDCILLTFISFLVSAFLFRSRKHLF